MRVRDEGAFYTVFVSAREVSEWNRRWPCSTLEGRQSFTFDRNGDLVDRVRQRRRSRSGGIVPGRPRIRIGKEWKMKIDWSKERCSVCGGEFKASSIQVTDEQTGKTSTRKVMACVRCGDTAFSPEQISPRR